jgi:hypothetical protein
VVKTATFPRFTGSDRASVTLRRGAARRWPRYAGRRPTNAELVPYVGRIGAVAAAALTLAPNASADPTLASRISNLAHVRTYCWSSWAESDVPDSGGFFRPADVTVHLPRFACRPIARQLRGRTPRDPNARIDLDVSLFQLPHERAHAEQHAASAPVDEDAADCRAAQTWRGLAAGAGVGPAVRRWLVRELRDGMGYDPDATRRCW